MTSHRSVLPQKAGPERRPVGAALSRSASSSPGPAQTLQQRLGLQGSQLLIQRATDHAAATKATRLANISSPTDPAEREAEEMARKVLNMRGSSTASGARGTAGKGTVQRDVAAMAAAAPIRSPSSAGGGGGGGSGAPLPPSVRSFMEPRFGANFGSVRIHTGDAAAQQSASLQAKAFTVGDNVYFGQGQYRPESPAGRELIAHELTHTIQQGAVPVVQRSADLAVSQRVAPQAQRSWLGIPNPREYFAGKASAIPGFTMLTVVIGFNPISNARVDRSAGNILRGAIQMIPGGSFITDALNAHGVFDKVSTWASTQFETVKDIASSLWQDIENFLAGFKAADLLDLGGLWDRAKALVERPIERLKAFAIGLKNGIVALIKEAILKPIANFARSTSGYTLLSTVMGKDPITGEKVPQDAESLLGGFMTFIGEGEIWANMQKAKAIPRAFAWFQGALNAVRGFVAEIPGLFVQAFKSLDVVDIILIPRAFMKLASVFGGFAVRFVTWGAGAVWTLLEIIFDVVSPGALVYIKKTGAALKKILRNPLPFVGNLVKAAKLGFMNFAGNFVDHLKAGLIDWLTGSLPGIYIPKAFSLGEIAKFAFSVLGLSWANIRQKLVKATNETTVKALESGFDIVVTLVRDGPAAAWEKIKEQLSNLKDMVIGGITDFVVDTVVKKAIPKLLAMFIPGAGFISAILSIYDTVMVFVNKIKQIVQVVTGFVDSIVAIAGGAIGAAATRVETSLAGVLSLAINFLAGFAGLGKVADKVMGVINKVRAPIDKALDWLVNWIVVTAKKLFSKLFGKKDGKPDERTDAQKLADLDKAIAEAEAAMAKEDADKETVEKALKDIKVKYRLTKLELVKDASDDKFETDHVLAEINPSKASKPKKFSKGMPESKVYFESGSYDKDEYQRQLVTAQKTIWKMKVIDWMGNREAFVQRRDAPGSKSGRDPASKKLQEKFRDQQEQGWIANRISELMGAPLKLSMAQAVAQARKDWKQQAALHPLDQVAGGGPEPTGMGDRRINSSIGSTWRTQVDAIYTVCKALGSSNQKKFNMNVTILLNKSPV
jgi:hypothetical protein